MGVFDLFGRAPKTKDNERSYETAAIPHLNDGTSGPVAVFAPTTSYEEVEKIIDALKEGKNTIVHLEKLQKETALRILDMLSGAIYALGGGVYEMEKNIFMFSPSGVEIL